jgi:hypothetical protein
MNIGSTPAMAATLAMLLSVACACSAGAAEAAGALAPESARCQILRADEAWRGTGVSVGPSQFVCVVADGLWSHGVQGVQAMTPYYGPEGFAKDDPMSVPEVVARTGALIGRIGGNAPFVIGKQLCFIPSTSGQLMLSMNDLPDAFGNNDGRLRVAISTWPASTPVARIGAQPPSCRRR